MYHHLFRILLLLFFCGNRQLWAQPQQQYVFSHYGTRDGLASDEVKKVQQDEKGFIWIATTNGLQRYDGERFLSFHHEAGKKSSIPNNIVYSILIDKSDRLWVLCSGNKVGYMDITNFTFHEIPVRMKEEVLERAGAEFFKDEDGNIMLSLTRNAVLTFNEAANEFAITHTPFHIPDKWNPFWVFQDKNRNYWIGCDSGLVKYNPHNKALSYRNHNTDNDEIIKTFASNLSVSQPFLDQSGRFWLYCWHPSEPAPHFYSYNTITKVKTEWERRYIFPALRYMYHEIHSISEQSDGTVWVTGLNVLAKLEKSAEEFDIIPNNTAGEFSIRYDVAKNVFEDKEKNVWVSTDKGLFRFNPSAQVFKVVTNHRPGKDSLYTPDITDIIQLKNGDIVVNTWGNAIFTYDKDFKPVKRSYAIDGEKQGEALNWCIIQRSNGDIWRAGQDGWIYITTANSQTTKKIHPPELEGSTARQLVEDINGNIWIGSQRGYVIKWDKTSNTFTNILRTSTINSLSIDQRNNLWVCTGGDGAYQVNITNGQVIYQYTNKLAVGKKLMNPGAAAVVQYDDSLYVIASGGLNILNTKTGRIHFLSSDNGLPSNTVINLILDRKGFLWFTTDQRVCRIKIVRISEYMLSVFTEEDGIPTSTFNMSSANMLADGRIVIGRAHDLILFNPDVVHKSNLRHVPNVEITGFAVMNSWLPIDSLRKLPEIKLRYDENSVTIEFSTLSFITRYPISYIMEGLDKKWTTNVKANQAVYNYLPPGDYTFKVKGRNEISESQITSLKISVRAPFYKTWWFYSTLALLAAALFYWEDRERMRRKTALQTMRSNIAGNLHEEINKALNNINMLSEIARLKADKEPEQSKAFINEIHHKSHNMIIAMDDVLWSIDPANDRMAKTIDRIKEFADALRHRHEVLINLQTDPKVISLKPDMRLRYEVMIIYKMGLRLLVEELKSPQTSINIDYIRSQLQLNIFAHHIQLPENNNQVIKMMDEMRTRAASIKAMLEFQSDEKGTAIILAVRT